MPDDPESDSLFIDNREDAPVDVRYSLIDVAVGGEASSQYRYFLKRWLKLDHQRVSAGELVAEISIKDRDGQEVTNFPISAPDEGVFLRAAIDPTAEIGPAAVIGQVRVFESSGSYTDPFDRNNRQPAELFATAPKTLPEDLREEPIRQPPAEIRAAMAEPTADDHGVFISYRRADEAGFAGRLYDRLVAAFDKSTVFMDVDSIPLGLDFVDVLHDALGKCRAILVVIGRRWLSAVDETGAPRLENPDDLVRIEVEIALGRDLRVIPMLVDGASMPRSTSLPLSMAELARRNGCEVSNARFDSDTIELINTLRRILDGT